MTFAPVVLFVYNRPQHTQMVLEALARCAEASQTDLHIFADGPKPNATPEQISNVLAVREIIHLKPWCGKVFIHESTQNKGLANSVMNGLDKLFAQHEAVIVMEDDIVPQIGFLKFMNDALTLYATDSKVFGVSAFAHPMHFAASEDTFFLPIGASWGWGTWARAWRQMLRNPQLLLARVNKKGVKNYNFGEYYFYDILKAQAEGKIDSWACQFHASIYLEDSLFLFPRLSLVKNIGFDSSGTHCTEDDFFSRTPLTDFLTVEKQALTAHSKARQAVELAFKKQFGKPSLWQRIRRKLGLEQN
ncbi:MAG: glycosyltransferase [Cytophagales bacterium]|nr:MAG: glycosyltransferase [Cytophagales bacterium]TAF60280.1 MAG: glycosyltransferase [Cytophagales bacterium]